MSTITDQVLRIASAELGVHEQGGNNLGARIEEYQRATGGRAGEAWCMDFVCWVMQHAHVQVWPRSGYCPHVQGWAHTNGILSRTPQVGDVFLRLAPDGIAEHTGFVAGVRGGIVDTVEGNTGGGSDTDGDGVHRKSRAVESCAFVHWQTLVPEAAPAVPAPPKTAPPPLTRAQIGALLDAAAARHNIPPDILKAVAWQESKWKADASSFDGGHGKGVMQIDDRTWSFARTPAVWDPAKNIEFGAALLSNLHHHWGGWTIACSRYNGSGPDADKYGHTVMRWAQERPWDH